MAAGMGSADLNALRIDRSRRGDGSSGGRIAIWIALLVVIAIAAIVLSRQLGAASVEVQLARVESAAVTSGAGGAPRGTEVLTANGYVVPRRKASVSSELGGRLAALYVSEGDSASAGQVLGVLRNDDYRAQIEANRAGLAEAQARQAEARAQLALSETEFKRSREMMDRKLTSESSFDETKNRLDVARARLASATASVGSAEAGLKLAQENLEKTVIRAPFGGTILRKEAEVGEIVSPIPSNGGMTRGAIVTMADLKSCEMEVDVNESYVARVLPGQPAEVELDAYTGVRFPARVRQVVPTADRQKATVQVKVEFLAYDTRILPEMGGKVYFMQPATAATGGGAAESAVADGTETSVPRDAVRDVSGRSVVYVVREGRAVLRPVQLLGPAGDRIRIGAGLAAGEMVVTGAGEALKDGVRIKVRQ